MSNKDHEILWSYNLSASIPRRAKLTRAASSSGESNPSPGTSIKPKRRSLSSPARSTLLTRITHEPSTNERHKIVAIGEGAEKDTSISTSIHQVSTRQSRSSDDVRRKELPAIPFIPAVPQKSQVAVDDAPQSVTSRSHSHRGSSSGSGSRLRTRPVWSRTRSGGVWFRQQKRTPYEHEDPDYSGNSPSINSGGVASSYFDIRPLKPPERPDVPESDSTHQVVVDSPFGTTTAALFDTVKRVSLNSTTDTPHRESSIDVKKLFSAPFRPFRRRSKEKQDHHGAEPILRIHTSFFPRRTFQSHKSGMRRDHTATNLERVSAVLEGSHRFPKVRIRTWRRKARSEGSSPLGYDDLQPALARAVATTFDVLRNHSPDDVVSATSSLLDLQRGSTPMNSLSEMATYKIKRHPSAETEEFLKLDISIRGGTSYLPSEARRIHTPPLPSDNIAHSSRGFFFDYRTPSPNEGKTLPQQTSNQKSRQTSTSNPTPKCSTEKRAHRNTTSKLSLPIIPLRSVSTQSSSIKPSPSRVCSSRTKTPVEWFESQLADIDCIPLSTEIADSYQQADSRRKTKKEYKRNLARIRRQEYEAQLDFNIPDHLPSSPLCPRNPRYWRVVKGRGSQFRGCWMHGFGEYEVVPGRKQAGALI